MKQFFGFRAREALDHTHAMLRARRVLPKQNKPAESIGAERLNQSLLKDFFLAAEIAEAADVSDV
jgi:hypothetical protein